MKESIRMRRDLLLVRKLADQERTKGGIYIPGVVGDENTITFFDVLEVGAKCLAVKPGDKIIAFRHMGGQPFHWNGEDLVVMREKNAWAVIENGTEIEEFYG